MVRVARRVGIAIGSVVIAYLAFSLVAGMFLGPRWFTSPLVPWIVLMLGGLIYQDIVRRERPAPAAIAAEPDAT
jgi:hypothetical protein